MNTACTFRPFTKNDWYAFADAMGFPGEQDHQPLICDTNKFAIVCDSQGVEVHTDTGAAYIYNNRNILLSRTVAKAIAQAAFTVLTESGVADLKALGFETA